MVDLWPVHKGSTVIREHCDTYICQLAVDNFMPCNQCALKAKKYFLYNFFIYINAVCMFGFLCKATAAFLLTPITEKVLLYNRQISQNGNKWRCKQCCPLFHWVFFLFFSSMFYLCMLMACLQSVVLFTCDTLWKRIKTTFV